MSTGSPPSPRPRPAKEVDETQLPQGHCRYILLVPELKGQRCGCAHFNLNRNMPGATCECGHLACYHISNSQSPAMPGAHKVGVIEQRLELLEKDHVELHQLRRDFLQLQAQLNQDCFRNQELIERVSGLEDATERSKTDVDQQVREAYRNLGRAWDSISELTRHRAVTDNQLHHVRERMHSMDAEMPHIVERQLELDAEIARISQRQHELADINISLEERIDALETMETWDELEERVEALESHKTSGVQQNARGAEQRNTSSQASTSAGHLSLPPSSPRPWPADSPHLVPGQPQTQPQPQPPSQPNMAVAPLPAIQQRRFPEHHAAFLPLPPPPPPALPPALHIPFFAPPPMTFRTGTAGLYHDPNELWTVHISLMPASTLPFPFERDTNAYKRCLSRGLHQMVPVSGTSAEAVEKAVRKAFKGFLRGHSWMPLKAEPCTADGLTGLPMLRQLDESLVDGPYDLDFLLRNCAVRNISGKIDSLYIAMRDKTISWYKLRKAPVFLEGLEACWNYDRVLDAVVDETETETSAVVSGEDSSEDEVMGGYQRPPAGDIVATLPSLKRAASEMSRSSSFGSATATMPTTAVTSAATATLEGEGSRTKVPRIHPMPNLVELRRGVKTT